METTNSSKWIFLYIWLKAATGSTVAPVWEQDVWLVPSWVLMWWSTVTSPPTWNLCIKCDVVFLKCGCIFYSVYESWVFALGYSTRTRLVEESVNKSRGCVVFEAWYSSLLDTPYLSTKISSTRQSSHSATVTMMMGYVWDRWRKKMMWSLFIRLFHFLVCWRFTLCSFNMHLRLYLTKALANFELTHWWQSWKLYALTDAFSHFW